MLTGSPNEHSSKLSRVQELLKGEFRVAKKPLPAGDYTFSAHNRVVCVEMKWSVGDLLASLQVVGENSGPRLGVEVRKMVESADIPILLYPRLHPRGDGKVMRDDGQPTGWQYSSVKGILADIHLYGVIVDEWEGDLAYRLAQWYWTLQDDNHQWIQQRGRPDFVCLDPLYREAVWALCAFAGVGPVAAQKLLEEFGCIAAICKQSIKDLQKVKGIGPKVAKSLREGLYAEF